MRLREGWLEGINRIDKIRNSTVREKLDIDKDINTSKNNNNSDGMGN